MVLILLIILYNGTRVKAPNLQPPPCPSSSFPLPAAPARPQSPSSNHKPAVPYLPFRPPSPKSNLQGHPPTVVGSQGAVSYSQRGVQSHDILSFPYRRYKAMEVLDDKHARVKNILALPEVSCRPSL